MKTANLGFPRIGPKRELKRAVEAYWAGRIDEENLQQSGHQLRAANWRLQHELGIDHIPSNDFSFYDQMLDMAVMLGTVPPRFGWNGDGVDLDLYFAMARGVSQRESRANVRAMEMTKWFDTNYHYLVPELSAGQTFSFASRKPLEHFVDAKEQGITTRPVLIGPITYLLLSKCDGPSFNRLGLLPRLLPVYEEVLRELQQAGASSIQIDEPVLVLDLNDETRRAMTECHEQLQAAVPRVSLMLTTYFGALGDNLDTACRLPTAGLHIDLVQGRSQLEEVLSRLPATKDLSLGIIDGRNVWRADLDDVIQRVRFVADHIGSERLTIAPSCSLLHCPIDLDQETSLDGDIRPWLAFAKQKLQELHLIRRAIDEGEDSVAAELEATRKALKDRGDSARVHSPAVKRRSREITADMLHRDSPFPERRVVQHQRLQLPMLPTTTIGSFPQTREVRAARADYRAGRKTREQYDDFLKSQIENTIRVQETLGLDVFAHGESERNDMVEYFGEQLTGFAFTRYGWVQSYGSRCVKPPIIYGDVSRPEPMTVKWITYAQSLTNHPVKGMLTGPITLVQWSFVRDDQPQSVTCRQIALAIRDEVADLEAAGIPIIQVDEAALREGLPLRRAEWEAYLKWAVECFHLTCSGVRDDTQIHTHMCYAEFNDIIEAIAAMDADVISIEAARSRLELLKAFENFDYPNEIGPGVYDIHSPRIPTREEIVELLRTAQQLIPAERLWVNPDCGLKTRKWPEVQESLKNMVDATNEIRRDLPARHFTGPTQFP
ncbi:MAG: 5-methyltetrahydropteroyltriglutamate--homocysteine S-methyltransferase [Pirellulaceae bacterium]